MVKMDAGETLVTVNDLYNILAEALQPSGGFG